MNKLNIGTSFKEKKFRYGGYAALLTGIVMAIVIAINLLVGQLNLKLDLTQNKLFSLSEQTHSVLDGLNKEVKIIALYESGKENPTFKEILNKYKNNSKQIVVEYSDPILYPEVAKKYSKDGKNLKIGSIIIECGNKFKVINPEDMVNYSYNSQGSQSVPEYLAIEKNITGAIMYATSQKDPVVYDLQGHDEDSLPQEIVKQMQMENYKKVDLNLLTDDLKGEEGDILLVISPKKDLAVEEENKIRSFLSKGGRAIFIKDLINVDTPNFDKLLYSYGVEIKKSLVVETDQQYSAKNPIYLIPKMSNHDIVKPLNDSKINAVMPVAQPVEEAKVKKQSIKVEGLLTTSDKAFGKMNLDSKNMEKENGDINGPINVAVTVTEKLDDKNDEKDAKVIVFSSSLFLQPQIISASNGANVDLFMNSLNWLQNQKQNISIRPKSLKMDYLKMNAFQQMFYSGVVVIIIPGIIMLAGLVVWLRRRHL